MNNQIFPWQRQSWANLQQMNLRLPHALLFHGLQGIGKTRFAEHFAQSLLCEAPDNDGHACGGCASCGWFGQYAHPDYRRVRPEILEDEAASEIEDGTEAAGEKKAANAAKNPSKEIKIDQIRALFNFINISTHRQGRRVVLLYPAEALNSAAANALLKVLEEPPPNTVFLLVSNSIDRLLPTIVSRCRKFPMPMPSKHEGLDWLAAQGIDKAHIWLAEQGGAPLAAYAAAQTGSREAIDAFLNLLAKPDIDEALKTAERLQKMPPSELVAWLQRWLLDVFSMKLSGRIRYYPQYQTELSVLARRVHTGGLLRLLKSVNERRAISEHPLSPRLFIEDMLLEYSSIFS